MIKKNVILNFVGFLLILEGLFMLLGIPFSIYFNDDDIYVLLFSGLGTSLIGFLLFFYTKNKDKEIRKREHCSNNNKQKLNKNGPVTKEIIAKQFLHLLGAITI